MTIRNQDAANQIAETLTTGVTHHSQKQATHLFIPGLNPKGQPTHIQEAIKAALQAISEGLIHNLEQNYTIIPTEEYNQLKDNQKEFTK